MVDLILGSQAISSHTVEDLSDGRHMSKSVGVQGCRKRSLDGKGGLGGGRGEGQSEGLISSGREATGQRGTAASPAKW